MYRTLQLLGTLALALAVPSTAGATDPPDIAPPGKVEPLGDGKFKVGAVSFNKPQREIRFPATVNMTEGLLEYAIVTENGKIHESLLSSKIRPLNLNIALLLLGYKESKAVLNPSVPASKRIPAASQKQLQRAQLDISLEWTADEKTQRAFIETWLKTVPSGNPAPRGPFIYTGSDIYEGQFVAEFDGNIAALYLDPVAVFNNPRPGNFNDETWVAADRIPDIGTKVTVVLTPHQPAKPEKP